MYTGLEEYPDGAERLVKAFYAESALVSRGVALILRAEVLRPASGGWKAVRMLNDTSQLAHHRGHYRCCVPDEGGKIALPNPAYRTLQLPAASGGAFCYSRHPSTAFTPRELTHDAKCCS